MGLSIKRAGIGMLEALAILRQLPKSAKGPDVPNMDLYTHGGVHSDAVALPRLDLPQTAGYSARGTCCESLRDTKPPSACIELDVSFTPSDGWFQVVAHQDDDLLFMNPSLMRAIECGRGDVVTVYLTAGDAGRDESYWRGREAGVRAAYAQMADVDDTWLIDTVRIDGVSFDRHRLSDAKRVQLLFCQLPDAGTVLNPCGNVRENLRRLWRGDVDAVQPVCEKDAVTSDQLIGALAKLMQRHRPARLNLLDCTGKYGDDHNDHHDSALFGVAAAERCGVDMQVALHRGYNIKTLPQNLDACDVEEQKSIFDTYIQHDAALCPPDNDACEIRPWYAAWLARDVAPQIGQFVAGAHNCSLVDTTQDQ